MPDQPARPIPVVAHDDPTGNPLTFLSGGGEVGALMRSHDWSASPLGHPRD
jgi:hypothetical protein